MYIRRIIERRLFEALRTFPVVVVLGPRQSGKTTLVKNAIQKIKKKVTYLDLELDEDARKLSDAQIFLEHRKHECVIIDEVQRIPDIFPLIRALVDQKRIPARFLITGSADPSLIRFTSESLAGRAAYLKLSPFNYEEIKDRASWTDHWVRGGFPRSLLASEENESYAWRDYFITSYIERDMRLLGLDVSPQVLRDLWTMIAHYNGGVLNYSEFGNALNLSSHTIKKYIDFLEGAFLISRLAPYFANVGKRLVKAPKIFWRDTGLLHSLLGIKNYDALQGYVQRGLSWEGYVIEQIRELLPSGSTIYYYRTHGGTEADIVISKGLKPKVLAEIKYGAYPVIGKNFYIAIKDIKPERSCVILPETDEYPKEKNIIVCSLDTFLRKHLPD